MNQSYLQLRIEIMEMITSYLNIMWEVMQSLQMNFVYSFFIPVKTIYNFIWQSEYRIMSDRQNQSPLSWFFFYILSHWIFFFTRIILYLVCSSSIPPFSFKLNYAYFIKLDVKVAFVLSEFYFSVYFAVVVTSLFQSSIYMTM